jgi:hypothetical protein
MSIRTSSLLSTAILFLLTGCGYLFLKEIKCREFKDDNIKLFPGAINDTITFVNDRGNKKHFVINDKMAHHTTNYVSDTGCSCHDMIQILLTSGNDSIWYRQELNYIYDMKDIEYFEITFVLDSAQNGFYENFRDSTISSIDLNGVRYDGVRKYVNNNVQDNRWVKEVFLAENVGLMKFEKANGEVWTRQSLKKTSVTKESFKFAEGPCN